MAVGDAAAHVNPTTAGVSPARAYAGQYAGEQAIEAIEDGTTDQEAALWRYNERVMEHFGARYAALDVYNIFTTAVEVDDLMGLCRLAAREQDRRRAVLRVGRGRPGPQTPRPR